MAFPRRSSRPPRSRFTLGLLLLTAVTLLVLDLPGTGPLDPVRNGLSAVFRPVRSAGDAVFKPISNGWKGAFGYGDVKDENDELRARVDELEDQAAQIARLEAEVTELEKLQGLDAGEVPTLAAKVVRGPSSSFDRTLEIGVGSDDGVKERMAVITGGGVLGRVIEVSGGSSVVELLTEPSVSIGIAVPGGQQGIVTGQGVGEPLSLSIKADVEVKVDDVVSTSGIDRTAYPAGVTVGTVTRVGETDGSGERDIEVEPGADLAAVYVKVVLKDPPK